MVKSHESNRSLDLRLKPRKNASDNKPLCLSYLIKVSVMIMPPQIPSTKTEIPFSPSEVRRLHEELTARLEEAKERRARSIQNRASSNIPFPPDSASARIIEAADSFCTELRKTPPATEIILERASTLISGQTTVYGAPSLPLVQHYSGVSEILQKLHDLALKTRAFYSMEEKGTTTDLPLRDATTQETPAPANRSFSSWFSSGRGSALVDVYEELDLFARKHASVLVRSPVSEDRQLIDSVNLALALAEDYNKGLIPCLTEVTASIKSARQVERAIKASGGDIESFPFAMAVTARHLTQLVGINMRQDSRKSGYTEARAPQLPQKPKCVRSILSKPKNP